MNKNKTNKTAIIPGGTGGIGSEVVEMFLDNNAKVVVPTTRTKEANLPNDKNLKLVECNYYKDEPVSKLVDEYSEVDTMVYCAGSFEGHKKVAEFSDEDIKSKFQTNIRSLWHFIRHCVPKMREKGYGNVIGISSVAAENRKTYLGLSSWAKVGTEVILETLDNEESKHGIQANILTPSIVDTPKERENFPEDDYNYWMESQSIADLVEFLCFDSRSKYIHGTRIRCYKPNPNKTKAREKNLKNRGVFSKS